MGKLFLVLIFLPLQGFCGGDSIDVLLPAPPSSAPPTPLLSAQTSPSSAMSMYSLSDPSSTEVSDGDDDDAVPVASNSAVPTPRRSLQETYLGSFPSSPMSRSSSSGDLLRSSSPKILILARYGLNFPFHEILSEIPRDNIVVIAPKEFETRTDKMSREEGFRQVIYIDGYLNTSNIDAIIPDLRSRFAFTHIVFFSENDVARAGRIADTFGLTGMLGAESSLLFREKLRMKQFVASFKTPTGQHFRTPTFREVSSLLDLYSFVYGSSGKPGQIKVNKVESSDDSTEDSSFEPPIVLKDQYGAGAERTRVFSKQSEIDGFAIIHGKEFSHHPTSRFLVETFVPGNMYHIDGIIQNGCQFMRAFSYMQPPLDMTKGLSVADYTLPIDDLLHHRLIAYTKDLLAKMPGIINGSFHLEIFHQAGVSTLGNIFGDIVFCEIAMRPGGGRISSEWEASYGFNFHHQAMRAQAGLALTMSTPAGSNITIPFDEDPRSMMPARTLSCGILFPANGKTLLEFTAPTFDFLHDFRLLQPVGTSPLSSAASVCDVWADAVVIGATVPELHANVATLMKHIEVVSKWSE